MLWDRKFKNFIFTVIFKVILLVLFPPFSPSLIEFIWSLGIPIFMKMFFSAILWIMWVDFLYLLKLIHLKFIFMLLSQSMFIVVRGKCKLKFH